MPNGLPSADTIRRVFARLDPKALERAFGAWTKSLRQLTKAEVVSLDGKVLRHSFDTACGQSAIHLVSAWASSARLVLGQVKVSEKSNEITAVPRLLEWLELQGCTVTVDALNTQKAIAEQIITKQADYVLALKENHPCLYAEVIAHFEHQEALGFAEVAYSTCGENDKGHGRIETRRCELITLSECDPLWQDVQKEWRGLRSLVRITCTRQTSQKTTVEVRYYLCSIPTDAKRVLRAVRKHWGIQNRLHYVLDVSLDEDACRIRKDHGPENFGVLRHIALNLLRQDRRRPAHAASRHARSTLGGILPIWRRCYSLMKIKVRRPWIQLSLRLAERMVPGRMKSGPGQGMVNRIWERCHRARTSAKIPQQEHCQAATFSLTPAGTSWSQK